MSASHRTSDPDFLLSEAQPEELNYNQGPARETSTTDPEGADANTDATDSDIEPEIRGDNARSKSKEAAPAQTPAARTPRGPKPSALAKPKTVINGKVYKPTWRKQPIDIDDIFSEVTWHVKATRDEMLWLMMVAGEDIRGSKNLRSMDLAERMVAIRRKRAAEGKAGTFLTEEEQDKLETASLEVAKGGDLNRTRKAWQAKLKEGKTTVTEPEAVDEDLEKDDLMDQSATTTEQEPPLSSHSWEDDPLDEPTLYTISEARSYLLAIKRQFKLDARYNFFRDQESVAMSDIAADEAYIPMWRDTYLRDRHREIMFSYDVQSLIRDIMQHREVVQCAEYSLAFVDEDLDPELATAVHMREKLCGVLVGHVAERLEWGGEEEARNMVEEFFGVKGV